MSHELADDPGLDLVLERIKRLERRIAELERGDRLSSGEPAAMWSRERVGLLFSSDGRPLHRNSIDRLVRRGMIGPGVMVGRRRMWPAEHLPPVWRVLA